MLDDASDWKLSGPQPSCLASSVRMSWRVSRGMVGGCWGGLVLLAAAAELASGAPPLVTTALTRGCAGTWVLLRSGDGW